MLLGVVVLAACTSKSPYHVDAPLLASCVESLVPGREAGLTLTVASPEPCRDPPEALVTIINDRPGRCGSNINATVSGRRMWFLSESGFGGEVGYWEPVPENFNAYADGVNEYPPGERSWPIKLPMVAPGAYSFTLPVSCGNASESLVLTATFRIQG